MYGNGLSTKYTLTLKAFKIHLKNVFKNAFSLYGIMFLVMAKWLLLEQLSQI